jgi:AroM protein
MTPPLVGVYTIGQMPRPDLTDDLGRRFSTATFEIRGALDALVGAEVVRPEPDGYPLETRLRDGTRVVADASFLEPLLQTEMSALDDRVVAHLVLCAGPFPGLTASRPVIVPFDVAVIDFGKADLHSLEVVLPFRAQESPAVRKWEAAGLECWPHVVAEAPAGMSLAEWLSRRTAGTGADAVVFDYVGFPPATLDEVRAEIGLPVFDLGELALDALEQLLDGYDAGPRCPWIPMTPNADDSNPDDSKRR